MARAPADSRDALPTVSHFDERVRKARMAQVEGATVTWYVCCDNCGGEGGFEVHGRFRDGHETRWFECPDCHGSGWVEEDAPAPGIEQDELPPAREEIER